MRKTLFRELYIYNIAIVILAMLLTALILYSQLGSYFKVSVYNTLDSRAEQIANISSYLVELSGEPDSLYIMGDVMKAIGNDAGQGYIITDREGKALVCSGFDEEQINIKKLDKDDISKALNGSSIAGEGRLDGVFKDKLLYVAKPIFIKNGVGGSVIMCSTIPYIQDMQLGVMKMFLWAMALVLVLTLFVAAVMSRRIAKPVKEMTNIAKKIAAGDFSQRVSSTKGELGVLASNFNQMTVALGEMDEVQSSFISDVSHELRTPMTIISGFVEGVLDGTIPKEEHTKYLGIVLSEIKRLNRLVNDLLEMSRLNSGKIEYKMVPFDITENIRKAVVSFEHGIDEKHIDVEVEFENDTMFVMGNSDSIYRVITNLMDNAIKFTPEGGKITIAVKTAGSKTRVSVKNTGNGLNEKELNHIWDRFYQTDKSRSASKKGVGLGLYIVKNIMKSHENEIYAESEEGEWTSFTFELDSVKNK